MDMKQLEYFLVLVKQENISSAANLLNITQAALSKSIARLEKEVGVPLFDHHGNRIALNDYGRNFARYAAQSLQILESGLFTTRQTRHEVQGSIAITCHAFSGILESVITDYNFLNPNVQIVIHRHTDRNSSTKEDEYDFILCSGADTASFLEKQGSWVAAELFRENTVIMLTDECKAFPPEVTSLTLSVLKDIPFIGMRESSHMFSDITFRLCTAAGFVPQIAFDTNDYLFKVRMIGAGRAACLIPECCVATAKRMYPQIRAYRIDGMETSRSVYLMRRKRSLMSEAARDFWDFTLEKYQLEPDMRD